MLTYAGSTSGLGSPLVPQARLAVCLGLERQVFTRERGASLGMEKVNPLPPNY